MGGGGGVGQGPAVNFDIKTVGTLTNNLYVGEVSSIHFLRPFSTVFSGGIYIIHVGEFSEAVAPGNSEFPRRAPLEPEVTNREE
jgi:hypothetical protein